MLAFLVVNVVNVCLSVCASACVHVCLSVCLSVSPESILMHSFVMEITLSRWRLGRVNPTYLYGKYLHKPSILSPGIDTMLYYACVLTTHVLALARLLLQS